MVKCNKIIRRHRCSRPKNHNGKHTHSFCLTCDLPRDRNGRYCSVCYTRRNREAARRYQKRCPERCLLSSSKHRAKINGLPFNLTITDIHIPEFCPVLGISLQKGAAHLRENSPTIDRFIASKGYVKGNIHVISCLANRIKSNASSWEIIRKVADWMEQNERKISHVMDK